MSKLNKAINEWAGIVPVFDTMNLPKGVETRRDFRMYNQALADIRQRIPELERVIVEEIREPLENAFYECNLDPEDAERQAEDIIKTLTSKEV